MKAFLVDVSICNGCYNCQIACKDEHCSNDWMPYARTAAGDRAVLDETE